VFRPPAVRSGLRRSDQPDFGADNPARYPGAAAFYFDQEVEDRLNGHEPDFDPTDPLGPKQSFDACLGLDDRRARLFPVAIPFTRSVPK
jgi:hypothetical protein